MECDVISFAWTISHPAYGERTTISRWFLGRSDNLPRGSEIGNVRRRFKILKINDATSPTDYFIPISDGYSEKLITGKEPKEKGLLMPGTAAPDWTLTDSNGKSHALSDYRGHIVVMDFWGTWCFPCWKMMPTVQSLHDKFKDRGVMVFGISVNDQEGDPAGFMKQKGYTYNLLLGGDDTAGLYKAVLLPTLYVIGTDGKIIHAEYGFRDSAKEELIAVIEKHLK